MVNKPFKIKARVGARGKERKEGRRKKEERKG